MSIQIDWDEIDSIEEIELGDCYDISVLENDVYLGEPNFIIDDVVVHNCGMDQNYIERKHGREKYEIHDSLKPYLEKTYGVLCVHPDTFVPCVDGQKRLRDITSNDEVYSVDLDTLSLNREKLSWAGPTRISDGIRLTLDNGFSAVYTPDHKVFTFDGYKEVKDIRSDDLVAVPRRLPCAEELWVEPFPGEFGTPEAVAYLVGVLLGDGCLTSCDSFIATREFVPHIKFKKWCDDNLINVIVGEYFHARSNYTTIVGKKLDARPGRDNRKNLFISFQQELGLRVSCKFKRIPPIYFNAPYGVRASLLAGLWDLDGHYSEACHYTSFSEGLRSDVSRLLLTFGLPVSVGPVRVFCSDQKSLKAIIGDLCLNRSFLSEAKIKYGALLRRWFQKLKFMFGFSKREFASSVSDVCNFAYESMFSKIEVITLPDDIGFIPVRHIEVIPEKQQFYCVSVPKNRNFFPGYILSSNCYQEQIMQVLHNAGGISLKNTYVALKAIAKKKIEGFAKYKDQFVANAQINLQITEVEAENIFHLISSFSEYGFNLCLYERQNVMTLNGFKEIRDFVPGDVVFSVDSAGNTVESEVVALHDHGVIEGYRVVFDDGYEVVCTMDHKFLTSEGQKTLREILHCDYSVLCDSQLEIEHAKGEETECLYRSRCFCDGSMAVEAVRLGYGEHSTSELKKDCVTTSEHAMFYYFDGSDEIGSVGFGAGHAKIADIGRLVHRRAVRILPVGKQRMYDLEVAIDTHNFLLSNGIVTSNSHSCAYSYISARLLYQKANYPLEFWAGTLAVEEDIDTLNLYRRQANKAGVVVNKIDLNRSTECFSVCEQDHEVYMGFGNIKGVGVGPAVRIVAARNDGNGDFKGIEDFLDRFGTEASVLRALIGLRVFKESDPVTLAKFVEHYRNTTAKQKDRHVRFAKSMQKYQDSLMKLVPERFHKWACFEDSFLEAMRTKLNIDQKVEVEVEEEYETEETQEIETTTYRLNNGSEYVAMCDLMDEKIEEVITRNIVPVMAIRIVKNIKTINVYKKLCSQLKLRAKSVRQYEEGNILEKDVRITLAEFNSANVTIKPEHVTLLMSRRNCELKYLGFEWQTEMELSPDYNPDVPHTYDDAEELAKKNMTAIRLSGQITKIETRVAKSKKSTYHSLVVVDANGRDGYVYVWNADWDRCKEVLKQGNLVSLIVRPPEKGWSSYSLWSPPRERQHELAQKGIVQAVLLAKREEEIMLQGDFEQRMTELNKDEND